MRQFNWLLPSKTTRLFLVNFKTSKNHRASKISSKKTKRTWLITKFSWTSRWSYWLSSRKSKRRTINRKLMHFSKLNQISMNSSLIKRKLSRWSLSWLVLSPQTTAYCSNWSKLRTRAKSRTRRCTPAHNWEQTSWKISTSSSNNQCLKIKSLKRWTNCGLALI